MKHFWILFSLLLVTLSVLPCSDTVECKNTAKVEVSQSNDHEKHNHETEQCPPFCTCACCGLHINKFQTASVTFKEDLTFFIQKKEVNFYAFHYNKKIAMKIWQPPQIS